MNKIILLTIFLLAACPATSPAQELTSWETLRDGNMLMTYQFVDKDGVHEKRYKHEIKTFPLRLPECREVQLKGQEIWLITQETFPVLYIVKRTPTAVQPVAGEDWIMLDPITGDMLR